MEESSFDDRRRPVSIQPVLSLRVLLEIVPVEILPTDHSLRSQLCEKLCG
jgi:hypothetical protein